MKIQKSIITLCISLIPLLAALPSALQATDYSLIDLGTLGGPESYAFDLNDNRQVTGNSHVSDTVRHAFVWDEVNGMQDLGTLGGTDSGGTGINNHRVVVGWSDFDGDTPFHAFHHNGSTMHDMGTLGGFFSIAFAINDNNQITGRAQLEDGNNRAFLFENDVMQDLGTLGGRTALGTDINVNEQVVGSSLITDNTEDHAFIWDRSDGMQSLGTLGGGSSRAFGINNHGQVTGYSEYTDATNNRHVFLWDEVNGMQDLGTLGESYLTTAFSINNHTQVTGTSNGHAFLWDEENGMRNLCEIAKCTITGWTSLLEGRGINNRGDIAGTGVINGENHAFLAIAPGGIVATIDILPQNEVNEINELSMGTIQVALLSTDEFPSYNEVDPESVEFGPDGASARHYKVKDVNRDGLPDMFFYFKNRDTGIECGDTEATLVGETYDGTAFEGTDMIVVKVCKEEGT